MEVSSHSLDQQRVEGVSLRRRGVHELHARPSRLSRHDGSRTSRAKARLLDHLTATSTIVVESRRRGVERAAHRSVDASASANAFERPRCTPRTCASRATGSDWTLVVGDERAPVRLPLIGDFNVINALGAAAAAYALSAARRRESRRAAVARCRRCPDVSRFCRTTRPCCATTRTRRTRSSARSTRCARSLRRRRLIVVFGCGGDRDRASGPRWAPSPNAKADWAIVTSDNPRTRGSRSDSRRHRARDEQDAITSGSRTVARRSRARWRSRRPTTSCCSPGRATRPIRFAARRSCPSTRRRSSPSSRSAAWRRAEARS